MNSYYIDRAGLYDHLYTWKDYGAEIQRVHELLQTEGVTDGAGLLEVACGTGSHLQLLQQWYRVAGFDLSPEMVDRARQKVPGANVFIADMTGFDAPDAPYDVVACLFSTIGHLYPVARLEASARAMAKALRPGGILILEPWYTPETYPVGRIYMNVHDTPELKFSRLNRARVEDGRSILEYHWTVVNKSRDVESFVDRIELALYPREVVMAVFEAAGFEMRFDPQGLTDERGLYLGRKLQYG